MSSTRRQARELAFQYLYSVLPEPPQGPVPLKVAPQFNKTEFVHFCSNFSQGADDFAWGLVEGVGQNLPSLDEAIVKLSTNWRIERMPKVDLTILRLAIYEILHRDDVPRNVTINEAVELAKKFGAEDSSSFVNGILDKISKPL